MKRALVLTNHLHAWAGSEIVSLEVSEVLINQEYETCLVANVVAPDIYEIGNEIGATVSNEPSKFDLRDFDFVWGQHFVAPLCKGFAQLDEFSGSFNSVHLSPFESFELAALSYTKRIGANIVTNSTETLNKIKSFYNNLLSIHNLNNATTHQFVESKKYETNQVESIKNILIVSNHIPNEVIEACQILEKKGLIIAAFGKGQKNYMRIKKEHIKKFDVIISIGKTVQYGILSRRPVFCYDRFGGPGYITEKNFPKALEYNFSGRCSNRKLSAKDLSDEILNGYEKAKKSVNDVFDLSSNIFDLDLFIKKLSHVKTKLKTNQIDIFPVVETAKIIRNRYISIK